jgi:hypothetical protein
MINAAACVRHVLKATYNDRYGTLNVVNGVEKVAREA